VTNTDIRALLREWLAEDSAGGLSVTGISYRSDRVRPGEAFFCIPGFAHDGHDFAADAVRRGAALLVVERVVDGLGNAEQIVVPDTRVALAYAAERFHGEPSRHLSVAGITGTNGKTTTAYLLDSVMRAAGRTSGLIGTVETRIGDDVRSAGRTTPESADLSALLAEMRDAGVEGVAMEVSSHAVDLHRVDAIHFAVAAFTNLSQDHLDYHHSMEEYFSVKRRLFTELDVASRVVNIGDPYGAAIALEADALTVGADDADIFSADVVLGTHASTFTLHTPVGEHPVRLPLAAAYNVSNALVATGCALALGVDLDAVVQGLECAPQVPGRLESIDAGQGFAVYVDYAHTPDSLEKVIAAVRGVTTGRVIVVFGCGGDRDPEKRSLMGLAAGHAADYVIVTSDNPRSEDPVGIILQIEDGLRDSRVPYNVEVERRTAIASALAQAVEGDAVLIAGKGHEDYQIFADRTIHFDDREVVLEELRALC